MRKITFNLLLVIFTGAVQVSVLSQTRRRNGSVLIALEQMNKAIIIFSLLVIVDVH